MLDRPLAEDTGGIVSNGHSLRLCDHRTVVPFHTVRPAAIGRVLALVALSGAGGGEVSQVECLRRIARADVKRLPARPGHLPCRVGEVQFLQPIGGGDLELRSGIELPVNDGALP